MRAAELIFAMALSGIAIASNSSHAVAQQDSATRDALHRNRLVVEQATGELGKLRLGGEE